MTTIHLNPKDFQTLLIYAQRYAIGRMTYASAEVTDIIKRHIDDIDDATRQTIIKDIESHECKNDLGMACDEKVWLDLVQQLRQAKQGF